MSQRSEHTFQFTAAQIAEAARAEAKYHEEREKHWTARRDAALVRVEQTIGAKVTEHEVTGGKRASVQVDYGDPAAWAEYQLAYEKTRSHHEAFDRYATDHRLYATQGARTYNLDSDDVHHFRLGGQERDA